MSEVKVDTISERTAAGGVTIDGVLIKDGVATFQTAAGSPLVFEGATADAFETTFAITDPTADNTITFPDSSFTVPTTGGKVLQLLEDNLNTSVSTTSTSYVASGLEIAITPASTASKFLLTLSGGSFGNNGYSAPLYGNSVFCTFYVDGSEVADTGPYERNKENYAGTSRIGHSAACLHSPSTVSEVTYTVYYKGDGDTAAFNHSTERTVFTVMELSS